MRSNVPARDLAITDRTAVGVDIGGGKIVAGRVDGQGRIEHRTRVATPKGDREALVETIVDLAATLGPGEAVGIGVAGMVTPDGELRLGPNLGVERVALRALVEAALAAPVTVVNDAEAALRAEAHLGAATGYENVVMLTLGTGVGGAVLDHGRFVRGSGFGGELGHLVIDDGGRSCSCGSSGCLEAYASGTAIGRRAHERLDAAGSCESVLANGDFDEIAVSHAAAAGDPFAVDVVREAGRWLGVGLTGIVNAYDPDLVVLGGGVTETVGPILIGEATEVVRARLLGSAFRQAPQIVPARLGDDAGMVGAALFALGADRLESAARGPN